MVFRSTELSQKEQKVLDALLKRLKVSKHIGKKKVVIGLIGLVGSGKTVVAEDLAHALEATVVSGNVVRMALRKQKLGFDHAREIVFALTKETLFRGGSVVIDSDFAGPRKRNDIKKIVKDGGGTVYFVRTVRDFDVIIGGIVASRYGTKVNDLFAGASTTWKGKKKAAVVKLREMSRRTPHHYTWSKDGGGQWVQKTIPDVYATIDTTKSALIPHQVRAVVRRIKN